MKNILAVAILGFLTSATMVACAPNRLYESFYPQFKVEEDCGFVQNAYGERVSWKSDRTVRLRVHESFPRQFLPALDQAVERWNISLGRKFFEVIETSKPGPLAPRQDGENVIYWMDTWEENKWTEQARTTVFWFGNEINEADIRINAKDFRFFLEVPQNASDVHLESLLIHELGHVMGLKHNDQIGSVMATYLSSGVVRSEIYDFTLAGLRCEY